MQIKVFAICWINAFHFSIRFDNSSFFHSTVLKVEISIFFISTLGRFLYFKKKKKRKMICFFPVMERRLSRFYEKILPVALAKGGDFFINPVGA